MTLPFIVFLYAYLALIGMVAVVTAVNLYHLFRFGSMSASFIVMAVLAVLIPAAIVLGTFSTLGSVNWGDTITIQLPQVSPTSGIGNLTP